MRCFRSASKSALERVWCEPVGKEIRLWSTGETWKLFDLGAVSRERYGAPYFMIFIVPTWHPASCSRR